MTQELLSRALATFYEAKKAQDTNIFRTLLCLEGGWEGWFQADFALFLTRNNINYGREVPYPAFKSLRADFCIDGDTFLEIKCASFLTDPEKFIQGIENDIAKLTRCIQAPNKMVICFFPDNPEWNTYMANSILAPNNFELIIKEPSEPSICCFGKIIP